MSPVGYAFLLSALLTSPPPFSVPSDYLSKMAMYKSRGWQCELTGKLNLTYLEALNMEKKSIRMVHKRMPSKSLRRAILRHSQWSKLLLSLRENVSY